MSAPCDDRRGDLAAAALGRLSEGELAELDQHLAACEACRDEIASLRAIARLLSLVDPLAEATEGAPPELEWRVLHSLGDELRARRVRRRAEWLAAAAAVIVLVVIGVALLVTSGDDEGLHGETVAFTEAPEGIDARAVIAARGDGTIVELHATGLDPDEVYALWLSSPDGDRLPAGTFTPDDDGSVDVQLPCALSLADSHRIWTTTRDGDVTLDAWLD